LLNLANFKNKKFKIVKNEGINAEVNSDTIFYFYQNDSLLYGEYRGGKIKYGEIFGIIDKNKIDFFYEQENIENKISRGKSTDTINLLDNKKEKEFVFSKKYN